MSGAMSIGPDGELYPQFSGAESMDIPQIKALRHGADFHNLMILGCRLEDSFQVYGYGLTLPYKAAGRMGNHVNIRIFYRVYHPASHPFLTLVHSGVHTSNHYIQFSENFVWQV
jgi:hypothetical protein